MITADYCWVMTDYKAWMNQRLFDLCRSIDDVDRKRDRGAFFGSIHATLNHILYGDLAFMARFTGDPAVVLALGVDVPDNFDDRRSRASLDKRMREWSSTLDARWLEEQFTDTSKVDSVTRTVSRRVLVVHMLNHQTHHRGQVTTTLSQMDLDIGTTDIPFMPQFQV